MPSRSAAQEQPHIESVGRKIQQVVRTDNFKGHIQQGDVMPVFKSYKPERFKENIDIFDFELTTDELAGISSLNQDYKYLLNL